MEKLHTFFSHAYRLLSLILLPPKYYNKKDLLDLVEKIRASMQSEHILDTICNDLKKEIEKLILLVEKINEDEELRKRYVASLTSTTISAPIHVPCPPYESIYRFPTEPKKKMISIPSTTKKVNEFYKKLGLQVKDMQPITEDHISVEVEFLAAIHDARKATDNLEIIELHSKFIEHLTSWIPNFVQCISDHGDKNLNLIVHSLFEVIKCDRNLVILTSK